MAAFTLNHADLEFILKQIKIAEANAGGTPLTQIYVNVNGDVVPAGTPGAVLAISDPLVPNGLRTVDGSYNNLVPGREEWGAADNAMPRLLDPNFRDDADGDSFDVNGPAPGGNLVNGNYGGAGNVVDADPRIISNLIVDMSINNPAAVTAWFNNPLAVAAWEAANPGKVPVAPGATLPADGQYLTNEDLASIPNIAPDEGLSAPFNAWMTFFGQFFDHGLDLISKGGNGTVFVPLQPDDPLITHGPDGIAGNGDEVQPQNAFMVLTRATPVDGPGADGVLGTADDTHHEALNTTTPFVDQNQTYTSHASHQVFLREYTTVGGETVATGKLLDGAGGGLPTWANIKAQAREMLGIELTDRDVVNLPLLRTDAYGKFIPDPDTGYAQVITGLGVDGIPNTDDDLVVSGTPTAPVNTFAALAVRTGHAFLDDIAHTANPLNSQTGQPLLADDDTATGPVPNPAYDPGLPVSATNQPFLPQPAGTYDNELLDRHFVTGDGRGNENIGLTSVHHIFHSEHNRQVEAQKLTVLQSGDLDFINEWLLTDLPAGTALPTTVADAQALAGTLTWDGERLFQAGRFATEMQYQHLVFEEFARKIQPAIDPFVFNSTTDINPSIFAEFAHTVYRFGHSMLTDGMPRLDAAGNAIDPDMDLIEAFLNPVSFDLNGSISHDAAAGAIVRGMTVTQGNEIDEFIVGSLRNNLLGLPLDLAAINIARARDTGIPSLNDAREQLYAATGSTFLKPYDHWVDFAANLKNPASVINFIAAYGLHGSVVNATTLEGKRDAATLLVMGNVDVTGDGIADVAPADRVAFLTSTGAWASQETGLNQIDLWIGGLAEKKMPFGGMLGSTFNAVFEAQMENLQDGDRFYYLTRTQGQNFLNMLEQNSFAKMIMANTDLSQPGADGIRGTADDIIARHIGVDAFADYDFVLEVNEANQAEADPVGNDPVLEAMGLGKVVRDDPGTDTPDANYLRFTGGEHIVVGGTDGNDTIITDFGDDGIWGDAGDDRIESGAGVDLVNGGAGNDIITDSGDTGDFIKGDEGDDVIANSNGIDILMGGTGKDAIFVGVDDTEVFGGEGNDFILGGDGVDLLMGNEGDDWMEAGAGFDTTAGDNSELFFNSTIIGHDVMFAGSDEHDFDAESGDDIMVQGESVMRNEGMFGFDWAIFKDVAVAGYADMRIPIFTTDAQDILRNRFDKVEALSGWENDDTLIGDDRVAPAPGDTVGTTEGAFFKDGLDADGLARIDGLHAVVQLGANGFFESGNVLLGGGGSDLLRGNAGDDILDGDRWLNVRISIRDAVGSATEIATVDSMKHVFTAADAPEPSWTGKSLFELLVSRTIEPGQLEIVREVLTAAPGSDVDTAVFNDVLANYTITHNADGSTTVVHDTVSVGVIDPATGRNLISDGVDTLRNVEFLQFADQRVSVNPPATGAPTITGTEQVLTADISGIADANGLPATTTFAYQWEISTDGATWAPINGATAQTYAVPTAMVGQLLRVVVSFTDLAGNTETLTSVMTAKVGNTIAEALDGTAGPNLLNGRAGDDTLNGGAESDVLNGGAGLDVLNGGDGNDVLDGGLGNDTLNGDAGNDTLNGGSGSDTLNGGAGNDVIAYAFSGVESLGGGVDTVDGGADADTLAITGTAVANVLDINFNGTAITAFESGSVANVESVTADLRDGVDTLSYAASTVGVAVDLSAGTASGFTSIANIENVTGGSGADTLTGDVTANLLNGNAGDDTINGGAGSDTMSGGVGNDTLNGGADNDTLNGDAGNDTISGGEGDDTINGGVGNDVVDGGAGNDAITYQFGAGVDTVDGGADVDTLAIIGSATANTLDVTFNGTAITAFEGGSVTNVELLTANLADGVDTLSYAASTVGMSVNLAAGAASGFTSVANIESVTGGSGADTLTGDVNANILNGHNGNDTLNGGGGNDTLIGGGGDDTIHWTVGGGRDLVDGGANTVAVGDTFQVTGDGSAETYRIYTRAEALLAELTIAATTEIVITRNGEDNASIIAELDNVEEIVINGLGGGDIFLPIGNFDPSSLAMNTITIEGGEGNDTVDLTSILSAHRIVFKSNGGNDTIAGTLRPQDVIQLPAGAHLADYTVSEANGMKTMSNGTHSVTFPSSGSPSFEETDGDVPGDEDDGPIDPTGFQLTESDLAGLKNLVNGRPAFDDDDDTEGATGIRDLEGTGNNAGHPYYGSADQTFIRLTEARYGELNDQGNRDINPIFDGLDARNISNILGTQELDLPKQASNANIFFMAFGQYLDHGLDFVPKNSAFGTIEIGGPASGHSPGTNNPADLTRAEVHEIDENGVPQHLNKTSPYVDQNQAYGSNELLGQFLRESDGDQGVGMRLLVGAVDPSNTDFHLLPTLRGLIQHHWQANTVFHDASLPNGAISFRDYFSNYPISETATGNLFDEATGAYDPDVLNAMVSNFMGSGFPLLLDTNPFVSLLDHYVAGDGRANENFALTAMHTVWARNHNFHVEKLLEAGFEGTEEEVFQAAKMINEAEYQRVVFDEFAEALIGGIRGVGSHGHAGYNPDADARISHEFASAVYRVGHSLIGQTMTVLDENGQPKQVALFDAFLNPSNDPSVFTAPLPPGYVPQPGYAQLGVGSILGGIATQPAEEVDFNIVDAVRNDLVRINADLFSFNVARGRDVGIGTLNQVRADLKASLDPYIKEAISFAGNMDPYASWEDFQVRNGLSNTVIEQFKQAYPDLVLDTPDEIAAFVAANPDIQLLDGQNGAKIVKGIDRVDLWVGGLAETHINGGMVGQTFWVVLHEQFDRLQEGDRFYYLDRFDNFDFYENFVDGQEFADIIARNTGLTDLPENIFEANVEDDDQTGEDPGNDDEDEDDDDTGENPGDDDEDEDDDDTGSGDEDDDTTGEDDDDTTVPTPPVQPGVGTALADVLLGTAAADNLIGFGGEDVIMGHGGADAIVAGDGNDFVTGGDGRDVISANAGDDHVFGGADADMIYGDAGDDRIFGDGGDDLITAGAGVDTVVGGAGNDTFVAEVGDGSDSYFGDEPNGGSGVDTLDMSAITAAAKVDLGTGVGGHGSAVSAQTGTDALWGIENIVTGSGADHITASVAVNVMDGGAGNDTFHFLSAAAANGDTIVNFQVGDQIDLTGTDANASVAGNQAFTLVAGPTFTAAAQLMVSYETRTDGDYTVVQGNTGGDNAADFKLSLKGTHDLDQSDFKL